MSMAPYAAPARPSNIGDLVEVGGAVFVRVNNPTRVEAYTQPGSKLVVMHDIPGHGGYFMVPDGNLLCGLIQWVVNTDGSVIPQYWMEKAEYDSYISQASAIATAAASVTSGEAAIASDGAAGPSAA
mmetsp:Transcript_84320/g.235271  ORF Transcript_84320/g.235271 Transcript_84320/m.235271 type:complete len:127 (+) Transcript_84320:101-481(+)